MAKVKPLVMSFSTPEELEKMRQEYEFIGRETDVDVRDLKLIVRTLPRKYKKKQEQEAKIQAKREQNAEFEEYLV